MRWRLPAKSSNHHHALLMAWRSPWQLTRHTARMSSSKTCVALLLPQLTSGMQSQGKDTTTPYSDVRWLKLPTVCAHLWLTNSASHYCLVFSTEQSLPNGPLLAPPLPQSAGLPLDLTPGLEVCSWNLPSCPPVQSPPWLFCLLLISTVTTTIPR
jgi:hypothetical protein